jgi:hypothetical protein
MAVKIVPLLLLLVLVGAGCQRRETAVRQRITGTWELTTNGHGEITLAQDGSLRSRFTGGTQAWNYEGTWHVEDDRIVFTTIRSNSMPCHAVMACRILRADGHDLVYDLNGQTIALSRK